MSSYEHLDTKLDSIIATLSKVEVSVGKLEVTAANNCKNIGELADNVKKQNGRVRKLELWRAWLIGIAAAVSALVGTIIQFIKP